MNTTIVKSCSHSLCHTCSLIGLSSVSARLKEQLEKDMQEKEDRLRDEYKGKVKSAEDKVCSGHLRYG